MGGLEIAAAAAVGSKALNLINERKQTKTAKKNMFANYVQTTKNRKNLLDQQLAARRARMGAAGLSSSASGLAAQTRDVRQTYDNIAHDLGNYKRNVRQAESDYRTSLISGGLKTGGSALSTYTQAVQQREAAKAADELKKKDPNQQIY